MVNSWFNKLLTIDSKSVINTKPASVIDVVFQYWNSTSPIFTYGRVQKFLRELIENSYYEQSWYECIFSTMGSENGFLLLWLLPSLCSGIKLHTRKIHFYSLVAQYTILVRIGSTESLYGHFFDYVLFLLVS